MPSAAIITVGDELLSGATLDTHAQWLSQELLLLGATPVVHATVGDDERALVDALKSACTACDVVIVTGGLGPTPDDLTREALAALVGPGLVQDADAEQAIRHRFEASGRPVPPSNLKQALRPSWMSSLPNALGTAPGLAGEFDQTLILALPGPTHELHAMWTREAIPRLRARWGNAAVRTTTVHAAGLSESIAAERLGALMERNAVPRVGITVKGATVTARIQAMGAAADGGSVEATVTAIEAAWGRLCFGRDDVSLASSIGELLVARGAAVATCESCTGGGVAHALTAVAGSSAWFGSGWVTYANEAKIRLGVDAHLIERDGAVSPGVAQAMARAAAQAAGARFGVATTGIAGPSGGTAAKPVGTVWIHVHDEHAALSPRQFRFSGSRELVRERTVTMALVLLRLAVLGVHEERLLWEVV